jgi:hypothetical protein
MEDETKIDNQVDLWKISGEEFIENHLTTENVDIAIRRLLRKLNQEERIQVYGRVANKLDLTLDDILSRELQIVQEIRKYNSFADPPKILETATMDIDTFLAKKFEERPCYLSPWLQPGTLAEIYAATGIGKTFLAYAIALGVTHGINVGPWVAENAVGVLIVDGEMPCQSIQQRLRKLSVGLPPRKAPLSIISSADLQCQNYSSPNLASSDWRDPLTEYLMQHPEHKILILDNVVSLFPGLDENSAKEWSPSNQWMIKIRSLNVALIKIHHSTKLGKTSRGTALQGDNMDVIIKLQRPNGHQLKQGVRVEVLFEKGRELMGDQADPFIFQIVSDPSNPGKLGWKTEKIGAKKPDEPNKNVRKIIILLDKKMQQTDIAKEVGCSRQYVSTVNKEAINDGILNQKGRLTDKGREKYHIDEDEERDAAEADAEEGKDE